MAGPAVLPADLLLRPGVGGVVRRQHVDGAVVEGLPHRGPVVVGHPVGQGVGAEPLDVGPPRQEQGPVVYLAAHLHAPFPGLPHQLDRPFGLHVDDVQLGAGGLGHLQQHGDGAVPDQAVVGGQGLGVGGRAAVAPVPVGLLDHVHDGLVVGVDHEGPPGGADGLEHAQQMPVVVDAGAARVGVVAAGVHHHVDLVGGHPGVGHGLYLVEFAGHRVVVPVDDALGVVEVEQLVEDLAGLGDRVQVGHPEHGGDPAGRRRGGAGADVLFVDVAGLAQMNVYVHHPRQHPLVPGVDDLHRLGQLQHLGRGDGGDLLARDQHVGLFGARAGYHRAARDHPVHAADRSPVIASRHIQPPPPTAPAPTVAAPVAVIPRALSLAACGPAGAIRCGPPPRRRRNGPGTSPPSQGSPRRRTACRPRSGWCGAA